MNLFTYRVLTAIGLPLISYYVWKRCRKHNRALQKDHSLPEIPFCLRGRFGFNSSPFQKGGIWIHAVSVGETRSIFPLLEQLKQQHPQLPITLTNSSIQGALHTHEFAPVPVQQQMLPFDYPFAVKRFLKQLDPKLVIMVETEIWPNLYKACHDAGIPVVLINARLKQSSFKAYQKRGGKLIEETLNRTTWISAQSESDAEHFRQLGVKTEKLKVLGNLKSDLVIEQNLKEKAEQWRTGNHCEQRPIWVAASTHADPGKGKSEEELILNAHKLLLKTHPDALLILAPRHAERFDDVANLIAENGLNWQRKTDSTPLTASTQVYLADSLGEMMLWYAVANIAFVGGSLVPFGGHNILEPAALKKPIISGQNFANLESMFAPFIEQNAIKLVKDSEALAGTLEELLSDQSSAKQMADQAHYCFSQQSGALAKTLTLINALFEK